MKSFFFQIGEILTFGFWIFDKIKNLFKIKNMSKLDSAGNVLHFPVGFAARFRLILQSVTQQDAGALKRAGEVAAEIKDGSLSVETGIDPQEWARVFGILSPGDVAQFLAMQNSKVPRTPKEWQAFFAEEEPKILKLTKAAGLLE
ncbi:MAG: hypothetical protein V1936_02180 [Patescibacteria group bacterium]